MKSELNTSQQEEDLDGIVGRFGKTGADKIQCRLINLPETTPTLWCLEHEFQSWPLPMLAASLIRFTSFGFRPL